MNDCAINEIITVNAPHYRSTGVTHEYGPRESSRSDAMNFDLEKLMRGISAIKTSGDCRRSITGLCADSRRVTPGSLFFALTGLRYDGNDYIAEAIDRGAKAIVSERPGQAGGSVAYIQVENIRGMMAETARRFYGFPDRDLDLIGVTGTNGKTTVAWLLKYLLDQPGKPVGVLGTIEYSLGRRTLPAGRTTPESLDLYPMLAQMKQADCSCAVMEVSSHGIEQERITGLSFKIAVFLNLTQDHIDYHKSMERYFEVKSRLFTGKTIACPEVSIINLDDSYGRRLLGLLPSGNRVITFGTDSKADFYATDIELDTQGSRFEMRWPAGTTEAVSPLPGRYNVSNIMAAMATGYAMGFDPGELARLLPDFTGVPGRMERVEAGQPFNVLVDYAHTDDALSNALSMLRDITPGRLLVVFGCGGNRDPEKRPLMTRAVMDRADHAWATADNSRGESLEAIFEDMKAGVTAAERITFVDERRWAISLALDSAQPGDCVLIAGKGHETFQEFADTVLPFDDRQVARELLLAKNFSPLQN